MKKLVLFSLIIAAVSQATGCIISSGDDDGGTPRITSTWTIKSIDGTNLGCPTGFDTAALYSQEIDAAGNDLGSPVLDLFDCVAGIGTSAPLADTTYYSWVSIETDSGSSVYAKSTEAFVDLTVENKQLDARIYDDAGYFQLMWQLTRASNGAPVLCADDPDIDGVESVSTAVVGSSQAIVDQFDCSDHFGITSPLPAGTYTVSVDAFKDGAGGGSLGTSDTLTNKTIQDLNRVTVLPTVTIPLDSL
ncbi:MAG: hypothetical protein ABI678_05575 [Kofleriaceae bacterium]